MSNIPTVGEPGYRPWPTTSDHPALKRTDTKLINKILSQPAPVPAERPPSPVEIKYLPPGAFIEETVKKVVDSDAVGAITNPDLMLSNGMVFDREETNL